MAKFRPSAIIQAISGRVGGVNFTTGKNGNIVRGVGIGQNNQHTDQLRNRAWLDNARAIYNNDIITNNPKIPTWATVASQIIRPSSLGLNRNPTGRELAVKTMFLWYQNLQIQTNLTVPTLPAASPLHDMTLVADLVTGLDWTYLVDGPLFAENITVFLARSFKKYQPKSFRNYRLATPQVTGPSGADLTTRWESIYGPLIENEWISLRAVTTWQTIPGLNNLWSIPTQIDARVTA